MIDSRDPLNSDKQLNPSGKPPLLEKDFIQNGGKWLTFFPFWLWIFLIAILISLTLGTKGWYDKFLQKEKEHDPFLEVTNRNFSVFLWQFPSFMRIHTSKKTGYLPGFFANHENFNLNEAEQFVSAPPDLIFLYHTWDRLLSLEFIPRVISPMEFDDFLHQLPEWQPENWERAPKEYSQLIESKNYSKIENLQTLPETSLPIIVRRAFQGWKNYFLEGSRINEMNPTVAQVQLFLKEHPHYSRNFWRNISEINGQEVAGSQYLYHLLNKTLNPETIFPKEQLPPFLKVALFNAEQAKQNH